MRKSVTLEGDSFDPAGTLTGGSRPQGSSGILSKLSDINEVGQRLSEHKQQLQKIDGELITLTKVLYTFDLGIM